MAILLSVVFGLLLYPIHVAGLTLCDTDGTLEVVESTASNVFTCAGAGSQDTITWILQRSNGNIDIAACTRVSANCNNPYKPQFQASPPSDDRSTLTVNGSTTSYLQYIQGQTIACKATPPAGSPQQTQCTVDVVAVPSVTCDAHYNTGTSSPWNVTVKCSVSGAYSYLNRYTCNLTQTSPTTKSLGSGNLAVTSTSGSGGKYKTGYCQVTVPYPDVTDVYSYKMAVNPGKQDVPASVGGQSSFEIKRPSTPPSHNCPQYVGESQGTSCTCTATDLGQPAGVVRWTSTMTNQLSLSKVNKNDNGKIYTCEVIWNGQRTQSVTYTLRVAYGPSSVSITNPPFPYDTNDQQQLTLTCSASDVNPAPTITWVKGSANNVVGQGRTYTFRPQPPGDDNSVFVCKAVNSITGRSRQDSTTLTLNYPPTQNPVITITPIPSNSGGHLYQGDRVTLTCAVTGGKPFGATTVTFTCPGKQDSPDIVGTSGVTSTVTFDSLTAAGHDKVCTCTTRWKTTNWYNKRKTVKLFVNCLTLCDTDGTLEVVENKTSNVFTCTGAVSTDIITWILQRSNGNTDLATCKPLQPPPDPPSSTCNNPYKPRFEASRPADDRSTLTVNGSITSYLQYIQGQTIVCRTSPGSGSSGSPQQTQCTVDIITVPSVTCDAHYNTGTSSPWTVTGNCSLSGAYSYLNRHTCNLIQTSPTTKSLGSGNLTVTSTSGSGGKYKAGYCQVTVPYPDVIGVYSYKMAVIPGRQDADASFGDQGSIEIKRPSTPPSHNCPQYVAESYGTSCTCIATDLGQPAGFFWWTSTTTNHLSLSNVNKNDNGATYTCEVIWNGQITQSVIYTLQVAYGPSSVSITHPPFPYDTNGQQQLNLTCSASDVNPAPTITWVKGSANNVVGQDRAYTFRPQPPGDDNAVFACRALNTITGTIKQDNTTLTLNYPPTQDPVITITPTPSNSGGHLYQGDRVTLTCAATGGKPFYATILTFQCPGKQDSPDIVGTSGVTSTVTFDSLTAADHDRVCTCTTRWKNTNWYNKNKTIKLFVSSSPPTTVSTKPNTNYSPIANVTSVRPESEPEPGFPVGVVVGVVAAVLVVSAIIVVVVLLIRRRRGRRQNPPPESSPRTRDRKEPAPQQNQPSISHASSSPYEDVDGPNATPVIKPKPKPQHGASAAQVATTSDVHVTVNTRNVPQSVPQDSCPVSAADNKKKEGSVELPTATPGVMKEKPKVGKKHAPNEAKQKGKRNNQTTEAPQRNQPSTSQASSSPYEDVDGPNAKPVIMPKPKPATMPKPKPKPQHETSAAQVASTGDVRATSHKPEPESEGSGTVDQDGLVYTAVTSTE